MRWSLVRVGVFRALTCVVNSEWDINQIKK